MTPYTRRNMPRTILRHAALLAAVLGIAASCRDVSPTSPRDAAAALNTAVATDLPQTIAALIAQIFPSGQRTAAAAKWRNVTDKIDAGQTKVGRKMLADLVTWMQGKTAELTPPAEESRDHAVTRLILYMSLYAYRDPSQPAPAIPAVGADAVAALIQPTEPATVVTPGHKAGIAIPQGAVSEPTVLAIYEDIRQERARCSGPLDTELCQYPRFYHFDAFPHQRLNQSARVGVCHITSGPGAPLRDQRHDGRLRVAHDIPTDPADYTPGAAHTDKIEILPLTNISDFLLCGNTTALTAPHGWHTGNSFVDRSWRALDRLVSVAATIITPKTLLAIDQGGGGEMIAFSTFAVVDPVPQYSRYCPTQTDRTATYADLDSAIAHVPESNLVVVCDGTWPANKVNVNRPLTLQSETPGGATLAQSTGATVADAVLRVNGISTGAVRIADLAIQFIGIGIRARGEYDQLTVDSVTFTGPGAAVRYTSGLYLEGSSVATAHVTLIRSSFTQSFYGAVQSEAVAFDTYDSRFREVGWAGLLMWSTPNAPTARSVTGAVMQKADIVGNVFVDIPSAGLGGGAIMIQAAGDHLVQNNQISTTSTTSGANGIFIFRGGVTAANTRPVRVRDNKLTGHAVVGDPSVQGHWGIGPAIRAVGGIAGVADSIVHNSLSGVFIGLDLAGPGEMVATDNTLSASYIAVRKNGNSAVTINRNDFTGYTWPIVANAPTLPGNPVLSNGAVACNWWGSASAPQPLGPNVNPGGYVPYATQPIANTTIACAISTTPPLIVRVCTTGTGSELPTVPTLPQAIQYVAPGGTVKICDGTYTVFDVALNTKSLTIEGEGPGIPTLDGAGNSNVFRVGSPTSNTAIVLRKLRLQNAARQDITVGQTYGSVLIDQVEFHPMHTLPPATGPLPDGVGVFQATGSGVTIQNSTFDGGDIGVEANNSPNVVVSQNSFTNQLTVAFTAGATSGSGVTFDKNTLSNCGANTCIQVNGPVGTFKILNNTINVDFSHRTENPINVHYANFVISGNVITGTGGRRSPADGSTWPMNIAIAVSDQATATVNGNRISGANTGMGMGTGTSGSGTDNVISFVNQGLGLSNAGAMVISRSDITNYATAFTAWPGTPVLVRCNWWGSSSGPGNVQQGTDPGLYTPWAAAPITNQPGVVCR